MNLAVKKFYVILTCCGLLWAISNQAAYAQSKPAAGIKGGLNVSNFYVEDIDDKNSRLGFHAGFYGQLVANEFFALQPEINFSTRGNEVISNGFFNQKTRFNLSYIDVPVLAVFKLGKTLELHGGAYGAFLVGANIKSEGDLGNSFTELDRDNFEKFDYGLVGGLGFNFGSTQIGARYNMGLAKIAKSNGANSALGDSKNSLGQLYIAFRVND